MELFLETFDLRQMLDEAVATVMQPLVAKNDNQLVIDVADDLGVMRADLTKLRQALFNLLCNAAKFTHEGTVTLTAKKLLRDGREWVMLAVSDTGIGIPADKLEHVFEEFSQADDSTTRDYGGTGLGLPISRRFCQMMGGDITIASDIGTGTTFTIELPTRVDALEAAKTAAEKADRRTEHRFRTWGPSGAGDRRRSGFAGAAAADPRRQRLPVVTAVGGEEGLAAGAPAATVADHPRRDDARHGRRGRCCSELKADPGAGGHPGDDGHHCGRQGPRLRPGRGRVPDQAGRSRNARLELARKYAGAGRWRRHALVVDDDEGHPGALPVGRSRPRTGGRWSRPRTAPSPSNAWPITAPIW